MDDTINFIWRVVRLFWYLGYFIVMEAVDLFLAFIYSIYTLFFSWQGWALISSLVLSGLAIAAVENQVSFMQFATHAWCTFYPIFETFYSIVAQLAPTSELVLCLYDAVWGFGRTMLSVAIGIATTCTDLDNWIDFLKSIPEFLLAFGSSTIDLLADPLAGNFTVISEDPSERTPWSVFQQMWDFLLIQANCQCSDLGDLFEFVFSIFRNDNLGWTLHYAVNSALAFGQAMFNVLVELQFPELALFFDRTILTLYSLGDWLDGIIQDFIGLFTGSLTPPDLSVACMITRLVGVGVELVAIVVNAVSTLVNDNVSILEVIEDLPLADLVGRIDLFAGCVTTSVTILDPCLGDAAGKTVTLASVVIEFFARIIQEGKFMFGPVSERFFDIWGDQTWDSPNGASHVIGITSPFFWDHVTNATLPAQGLQTGLVCFIKNALGGSECALAAADLTSAVGQVFALPVLVADQVISLDYDSINFNGNPANDDNRDRFENIITNILSVLPDRLVLLLDYTGHFIACIPGLDDFGIALQVLAALIANLLDDIVEFVVITLMLIYQVIIWFISLLGASPFDGEDEGTELVTLFGIFADFFIFIWDVVSSWLTGLIDYTIFPYFATFFGQNSLLADTNPGTARFTVCFTEIEDCLCGLTKASIGQICMGALGCLSSLWPDCGDFEPDSNRRRKRSSLGPWFTQSFERPRHPYGSSSSLDMNATIWEFWALNFNDTICGPTFQRWADSPPEEGEKVGETDGMELLNCVNMAIISGGMVEKYSLPNANYLMNPDNLHRSGKQVASGLPVISGVGLSNTFRYYADPANIRKRPSSTGSAYDYDARSVLKRNGITNPTALQLLIRVSDAFGNLSTGTKNYVYESLDMNDQKPNLKQASLQLGARTGDWLSAGGSLLLSLIYEGKRAGLATHAQRSFSNVANKYWGKAIDGTGLENQEQYYAETYGTTSRKRSVHPITRPVGRITLSSAPSGPQANMTDMAARLQSNRFPVEITRGSYGRYRTNIAKQAMIEYRNHFLGRETLMPRFDSFGDLIITEATIPLSCTSLQTNCSVDPVFSCPNPTPAGGCLYTSGSFTCTGPTLLVPHHDTCYEFFGTSIVAGKCNATGTIVNFYASEQQCEDDANDIPGNDPIFLFAPPGFANCVDGGVLGALCMDGLGCTDCPITQVFPGFECALLDETRYHFEDHLLHCIDKLGLGPGLPQFPTNITAWEYDVFENPRNNITARNRCGNGIVEPSQPVVYRNPITKQVFNFSGEQCDPPNSFNATLGLYCGPACQYAACGNGVIDPGEACDDNNTLNGDTCTSNCKTIICGNGIIDMGEECDDGNTLDYDGCSARCKKEICPQIRWQQIIPSTPYRLNSTAGTLVRGTKPKHCFRLGNSNYSVELICSARIPVLWAHDDPRCWSPPEDYEIKDTLANTDAICVANDLTFDFPDICAFAVQTGTDFSCVRNCSVCGNAQVEPGETCDDGSIFPTGNPIDDQCLYCQLACTCNPNPSVGCIGRCGGGPNQGAVCNPRDSSHCPLGTCIPTQCCGDQIQQGNEQCDDSADPLTINATSNCFNCAIVNIPSCTCQPGLPCMGICYGFNQGVGEFVPISQLPAPFSVQSTAMDFGGDFPCDVNQGVFACPGEGQICFPRECCGDGDVTYSSLNFCDPPSSMFCNATCNMVDPITGLIYYQGVTTSETIRLYGFRDHCKGIFPPTYTGTCDFGIVGSEACKIIPGFPPASICDENDPSCSPLPDSPMPIFPAYYTTQIGLCHDQYGFIIRPAVICNRANHSTCEYLGYGNTSYCVAEECCGDGIGNQFGDYLGQSSTDVYGVNGTCEMEEKFPSLGPQCVCQTNETCVGVCTYNSMPTRHLCDPRNVSNTPWCTGDPLYACVAIFCCNDGNQVNDYQPDGTLFLTADMSTGPSTNPINEADGGWSQYWNPISQAYDSNVVLNLGPYQEFEYFVNFDGEQCENNLGCPDTRRDCGLFDNLFQHVWTQCVPQYTLDNINYAVTFGICVNASSGDVPLDGFGIPTPCDFYSPSPDCPSGISCFPQDCCGDGIWSGGEACDPTVPASGVCDNYCNVSAPPMNVLPSKKRQVMLEQIRLANPDQGVQKYSRKRQAPLQPLAPTDPRQMAYEDHSLELVPFGIMEADYLVTYQALNFSEDFLSELTFDLSDFVAAHAGLIINSSETFDKIVDFFTDTNTDKYVPFPEKGFLNWVSSEFRCVPGLHTTGELGAGIDEALKVLVKPFLVSALFVGAASAQFGGVPATILLTGSVYLWPTVFMGYAFGFPFPWCLPLWPENFVTEIVKTLAHLNYTTIQVWDQLLISADEGTCEYTYRDCREFGLFNGLDYFLVMLQDWFPEFMDSFFDSSVSSLIAMLPGFADSFARVRFPGGIIPENVDQCVDTLGWLVIFEFIALSSAVYLLAPIIFPLISNFLSRLALVIGAFTEAIVVVAYVEEDPVFM